jgi:hypothetical protein
VLAMRLQVEPGRRMMMTLTRIRVRMLRVMRLPMEKNRKTVNMMRKIMVRTRVVLMIRMIIDSRKLMIMTSRKLIMMVHWMHRCMTLTQGPRGCAAEEKEAQQDGLCLQYARCSLQEIPLKKV